MVKHRYVIAVILATLLVLLNLPAPVSLFMRESARDNVAPFQNVFWLLVRQGRKARASFLDERRAAGELTRLRKELAQLSFRLDRQRELEQENRELRHMLDFVPRTEHRLVLAEVVARGGMGGWWQTVRLNRGRAHGVRENLPVITSEGLVGRTGGGRFQSEGPGLVVSEQTSDVLLLADPGCRVAVKVGDGSVWGIVSGAGAALRGAGQLDMLSAPASFDMNYIPKYASLQSGDEVFTSGQGGVYPPGIRVGRIGRVEPARSGLYQSARVEPAVDLRRIRYVFIVVPSTATAQDLEKRP